jgi:hypothetical protein
MSASPVIPPQPHRLAILRRRETATEAMIHQIDEKLLRLDSARRDRAEALQKIRSELVRALKAEPAAADCHEQ